MILMDKINFMSNNMIREVVKLKRNLPDFYVEDFMNDKIKSVLSSKNKLIKKTDFMIFILM